MISARGLFLIVVEIAIIIGLLKPIAALGGLRTFFQKRILLHNIDLCTQSCYSQILPGLYLSNARAATDLQVLRHLNVTHVLTIEAHRPPRSFYDQANITTLFIRANDTPQSNLLPYFSICNTFIDEGIQHGTVLVHCHFGVSRSATIVIAYIMQKYKLTFEQAFEHVRQKRKFINPNPGFIRQLKEYEKLDYDVGSLNKFENYFQHAKKHKYKIVSLAALAVGILVPIAVMVG